MLRRLSRFSALMMLVLATFIPATIAAQDATPVATPLASPVGAGGVEDAVIWLMDQQQEDGSWLGFSGEPDAGTTIDAIIALAAADEAGLDVGNSLDLALAWLDSGSFAADYATSGPGAAAKLVLALVAVGDESLEIGGTTPLEIVLEGQDPETDLFGFGLYDHAYSLMALAVTDSEIPAEAISVLETMQADNGGFAWDGSTDEAMVDSNTTAMIVLALTSADEGDHIVAGAIDYLRLTVNDQGAGYSIGAEADANSTALVLMAYIAVGEDHTHLSRQLSTFQNSSGAYFWMATDSADNPFTTIQVIPAGVETPLPVVPGMLDMQEAA